MEKAKAVVYARQSSGSDDVSESVEVQIKNCINLAKKENLDVVGIFKDLNVSGKTYPVGAEKVAENDVAFQKWFDEQTGSKKYRQGLGDMFSTITNEKITIIITDESTRLYRPYRGSFLESYVNTFLTQNKVKISQVKGGGLDLSRFDQSLIQTLKNQINDEQIANQRKKVKEALNKRKQDGKIANGGNNSTGMERVNGKLFFKEEYVEFIKYIFEGYANYAGTNKQLTYINEHYKHLITAKSGIFHRMCFKRILSNPIYCGYCKNADGELVKNVEIEGEAPVSFDTWLKVQKRLADSRNVPHSRAKKRFLPFSGILKCGYCGKILKIHREKYICENYKFLDEPNSRILLSSRFGNNLYKIVSPLLILSVFKRLDEEKERLNVTKNLEAYKVELANLESKKSKLTGMFLKELITESDLESSLTEVKARISELKHNISECEILTIGEYAAKNHLHNEFKKFEAEKILQGELDECRFATLVKETIKRIDSYKDKITVRTIYGDIDLPKLIKKNHQIFPDYEYTFEGKTADTLKVIVTLMVKGGNKQLINWCDGRFAVKTI